MDASEVEATAATDAALVPVVFNIVATSAWCPAHEKSSGDKIRYGLIKRTMNLEQINEQHQRREKQDEHHQARADHEQPVLPRMPPLRSLVADEQVVVAAIRRPRHVSEISDDGHCPQRTLHRQVQQHANERNPRRPPLPRRHHDKHGRECSQRIADSWNPPDQSVEPETNPDSRNFKSIIQPTRDQIEMFIGSLLRDYWHLRQWGKNFTANVGGSRHMRSG